MNTRLGLAVAALVAAFSPTTSAQSPHLPQDPVFTGQPAPGSREGTERWVVHFATRPFTLDALRDEYHGGRNAEKVAELVADLQQGMKAHQAPFVAQIEKLDGKVISQLWLVNTCTIEIAPKHLAAVRRLENVAFLQPDVIYAPLAPIKTATDNNHHRSDGLNAKGVTGAGIAIAICDSGHDSDMNLTGKPHITYSEAGSTTKTRLLFNKKIGVQAADDVSGHGTAVGSCAAGWKWNTATADQGHAYDAKIAGYAMADFANGNIFLSTAATAWQQVVTDAAANKIRVGNMSYAGSPDPLDAAQQALDTAVTVADLLICTAGGNAGADLSISQVCLNGLSVGAVAANTKALAGFSATGFLAAGGTFPDLVANGVAVNMALRDNEGADNANSGTSFASPMVAGAAALIRAANPHLKANETKAVLLASTEVITGTGPNQVAGIGCGYLRDDLAYEIAMNPQCYGRAKVSTSTPFCEWPLRVTTGKVVQVAIAWHRIDTTKSDFSDLQLILKRGATTLVSALSGPNSEEFVRFTATADEVLTVRVSAFAVRHVTEQEFAWATNVDSGAKTFTAALGGPGFANALAGAGDFNNDGYNDLVIGHPQATVGTLVNAGVIHVFSGKDYSQLTGGGFPGNTQNARFGTSLAAADIDQDGFSDVVLGAPGAGAGGSILVLSGRTVTGAFFASGTTTGLGQLVTTAQYLDADGFPDIVATDNNSVDLIAFSGRTKLQLWKVTPVAGVPIRALATVGDINDDGLDDIIVGLPSFSSNLGRMEVRSGKNGALLRSRDGQLVENLGSSVAGVGDVDGDGVDDYMFGSPSHPSGGTQRGNCAIQSGRTGAFIHILFGESDNLGLGYQVGGAGGDVDGDGTPDFMVSLVPAGVVRIYSGKDARLVRTINGPSTTFGAAIAGLSTSGDDQPDFLISEPGFARAYLHDRPAVANPPGFSEYRAPCAGSATGLPRFGFTGAPVRIGRAFTITLASAPKSAVAALQIGTARTSLDLSALGLTGCFSLVQSVATLGVSTNALGRNALPLAVPFSSSMVGGTVHMQWLCIDAGKLPLPLVLSTGGSIRVGGQM